MLGFFRRFIQSRLGIVVTFIVLGIIALAFAAGDVTGLASRGGSGITGGHVAKVGSQEVTIADLRSRAQTEYEGFRQQQPTLDLPTFVAQGGLDGTLQRMITSLALQQFGEDAGMVVSKRLVDGQIASIPGLQGATGKFDPLLYQRILVERKMTDAQVRDDIARDIMVQQLTLPTIGASQVPAQLALPYASLLLEKRAGQTAIVETRAMSPGAAPTDRELTTFYARNLARYTVPERRVVRYAIVASDAVRATAKPTDAEIAQAYQARRASYAATQRRTIAQVVVADQAGATAIAAKVKAGTSVAAAAQAAGLEASTQSSVDRPTYAAQSSAAIADAAFAAPRGAVVGPIRGPLGWTVARVEAITEIPARTLADARTEIATALSEQKATAALGAIRNSLDDALADRATFDELIKDQKLTPVTTPPLLATGIDPEAAPGAKPDPKLAPFLAAAFQSEEGDAPQLVPVGADGSFAVVGLGRVVPAAPRLLAQICDAVTRDFLVDRERQAARLVAGQVIAKVNKGMPLAQAMAETRLNLPSIKPLAASRAQIAANPRAAPAPLVLMFSMAQGTAKLIEAPDRQGWIIVRLDRIDAGNAAGNRNVVNATRADIGRLVGREYAEQFARAITASLGVKRDDAAIAKVRDELTGKGASNN